MTDEQGLLFPGCDQVVPPSVRPQQVRRTYGSKGGIAPWIVSRFPEHEIYCEPFCESCSVLFAKRRSTIEIVNDLDGTLVRMYETIRSKPAELAALLWATPYSPENWSREHDPDELEGARLEIAKSGQFYCGAASSTWAVDLTGGKASTWANWFKRVLPAAERLKSVQILNEDALKAISRVADREEALLYVDPPYLGHEGEYKHKVEYDALVEALRECRCKVVVSEFETAAHKYEGWRSELIEVSTNVGAGAGGVSRGAKKKTEVLFFNWEDN